MSFCGNIMCIAGQNEILWLIKATGMDINGCDMPNDSNCALFRQWGVLWVRMGSKWRIGDVVIMVFLEIKNTVSTCLPGTKGSDSFPKRLDLALAPNKTNEGAKKQWNIRYHDKLWHIVTRLAVFRLCIFLLVCWRLRSESEWVWGSWQLLNPLNSFDGPETWFQNQYYKSRNIIILEKLLL